MFKGSFFLNESLSQKSFFLYFSNLKLFSNLPPPIQLFHQLQNTEEKPTQSLCSDTYSAGVQGLHGNLEPQPRLSQQVLLRDLTVLEDYVAGGGGPDPQLVLLLPKAKSLGGFWYDKSTDPLVLLGLVRGSEHYNP